MTLTIVSDAWSDGGFSVFGDTVADVTIRALERCVSGYVLPSDIDKVKVGRRNRTEYFRGLLRSRYRLFKNSGKYRTFEVGVCDATRY